MAINKGLSQYGHIFKGTQPLSKIYKGPTLLFENVNPPIISSFSANPNNIDLDISSTGNIALNFSVRNSTRNRIYNVTRNNLAVPLTSNTGAVVAQPNQPTTYRLVSQNVGGANHRDVSVNVTKNPTISNFRKVGQAHAPLSGYYFRFAATITGLPRPSLRYEFRDGGTIRENGTIDDRHYTQGANPYTWEVQWAITLASNFAYSLRWIVTNASGSAQADIANISV